MQSWCACSMLSYTFKPWYVKEKSREPKLLNLAPMRLKWCSISETSLQLLISMWLDSQCSITGKAIPDDKLRQFLGNSTWETKGEKKKGTHTNTQRAGLLRRTSGGFRFKLKRTKGLVRHSGATLIFADSFHRWLCIQRQARSERTDENDLKQRVIYTTHPPHNTQRFEFYSSYGLRCKATGPRGQRGIC